MKTKLLVLLLLTSFAGFAQSVVKGTVVDDKGQTLPGVSVLVKGTTQGTVTDIDGAFTLNSVPGDGVLVFSFIGYLTKEVAVAGQTNFDVTLEVDVTTLEEVVVVGYGTQKKSVATASIAKVEAKDLAGFSVARVDQMLQGQVAGVTFKNTSGQPGSGMNIFIRGVGTNGDNRPLIIVDGIVVNDQILQSLNPADIESIQVLKDGASAAIYGSRAANGIIQVTTKKGIEGQSTLSYSANYGVQQPWRVPELLNAQQYVELLTEKYEAGGTALPADFPTASTISANTDWMDRIFETGSVQSHSLSFSSGSKNGSVLASLSYFKQNGVIAPEKSNFERVTARINATQKVNDFLGFGANVFVMRSANNRIPENSEFGTPIADALVYDPTTPALNADAQYGFAQSPFVQKEYMNPLSRIFISNTRNHADEVLGNVFLKVTPIKGLTLTSDIGADLQYFHERGFTPSYAFTSASFNEINDIYQNFRREYRWQWENYATYGKAFGKHNTEFTVGTTMQVRDAGTGFGGSSSGIPVDVQFDENFWYINQTADSARRSHSYGAARQALGSVFGRVNYNYDEKYLATVTLRRDGSTQFGENYRYGIFPSVSVGWVASREAFWPQMAMNFFKFRAGYGVNGNDRIESLVFGSTIRISGAYPFGRPGNEVVVNGLSSTRPPNPNVKWEESRHLNIGFEAGFWNDMLTLEVDYYNKNTYDLLMTNSILDSHGFPDEPIANVGGVTNKGIEIETNFRKSFGDVGVHIGFTAATLKNEVTEMSSDYIEGYTWPIRNTPITRMELNRPIGYFRGYQTAGIFTSEDDVFAHINSEGDPLQPNAQPGDLIFVDTNEDGVIDELDKTEIGKPWADVTLGLSTSVTFRGFDFRALFAASIGNDIYRSYERQDVVNNNYSTEWLNRWSEANPGGTYPRLTTSDLNNNSRPSDFYVEDASFLRLRNIQLGYSLPKSILSKLKLTSLRVYASADNILTITGYTGFDPEIGIGASNWILDTGIDKGFYPQMKTVSGGINLSF